MFVFGYAPGKDVVYVTVMDKNRKLRHSYEVQVTNSRMIHDLHITEKYVIIPDLPMEFNPKDAVKKN